MRRLLILGPVVLVLAYGIYKAYRWYDINDWESRLDAVTSIERIGDHYFLVDCWHNRVLYSTQMHPNLKRWRTLDGDLRHPHSIASDGHFYVVEDTERHRVKVYVREGAGYRRIQILEDIGTRPHRVRYEPTMQAFFVMGSRSQTITKLVREGEELAVEYTVPLPYLEGAYTRSFAFIDGSMFLNSGPGRITRVRYWDDSFAIEATYDVPAGFESMIDLIRVGDAYYLTAEFKKIVRTRHLEGLARGEYEEMYDVLGLQGTPYSFSWIDGRLFLTQDFEYTGVVSFAVEGSDLVDRRVHYDFPYE